MAPKLESYTIAVDGPDHKFKRAIDESTANKIISFVMTGAVLSETVGPATVGAFKDAAQATASNATPVNVLGLNPKQFIAQKKPKTQYERIACLAYYLTNVRGTAQFVTDDITALNTEAAQQPILNAPQIVRDTTQKYRYLTGAGDRNKQITVLGEAIVEALPDRDAVKAAITEHRPTARKKKRSVKKKKKT